MEGTHESWFERTDRVIMNVIRVISWISGLCLVGIMIVAFVNVLGEKLLHTGIPGSTEIITYLHVPVVFLAAGYVTLDNGHTRIDLLSSRFPKTVQKVMATVGFLIAAGICAFVAREGFIRMAELMSTHSRSSTSGFGFVVWPFAFLFSVGMALLALSFIWAIVRQYAKPSNDKNEGGAA